MKNRIYSYLFLILSFVALTSISCKKQTLSNLEGRWALVPIGTPGLLPPPETPNEIQAGWDIWEFTGGKLKVFPGGGAVKYEISYSVSDVFIESYLVLKDISEYGIPIIQELLDKKREFDQYNTKYTIVKLSGKRLVIFSQKAGGIQREFLKE